MRITDKTKLPEGNVFRIFTPNMRYFKKGILAQDPNISFVYNSPRDEMGNETHTTSIAVVNYVRGASYFGYVKGIARGVVTCVRLAVYKVTWSRGGSLTSGVITGALPYEDPIYMASFTAMEKGVLVSSPAWNRGSDLITVVANP
ncbi:hypothetical protein GIB67_026271 [Kingdonia uniflora]|uniref:Uncharacterized protein n=1 Tax=Kingdonia uniflora TaxID=39325 RepID=A0A7J7LA34_9MAGN|nr:hypothetical protein GIB67_026271 [Kingdonia uniflora]